MSAAKPLSAKSSIGDWLNHPVGGQILREALAAGGQSESALRPVKLFSLQRVASMSKGAMTEAMVADWVARANSGEAATSAAAASDVAGAVDADAPAVDATDAEPDEVVEWAEVVTAGRFAGKTVIVTGAGSGIGRATASRVAREGGRVIAVDVSQPRLDDLVAEFPGGAVVAVTGDITKDADIAAILTAAGDRIDALANVAGVMDDMTPIHEVTDMMWERVMGVNVTGLFKLTRAVVPVMLAAGVGSVGNVGSEASLRGSAAGLAYTASKHAVVGITKSSSYMYAAAGIRFNLVAPGPVATNIEANFASELGSERIGAALAVLPPVALPNQLAASITFLLSDDATNITGAILPSDGGWSAI